MKGVWRTGLIPLLIALSANLAVRAEVLPLGEIPPDEGALWSGKASVLGSAELSSGSPRRWRWRGDVSRPSLSARLEWDSRETWPPRGGGQLRIGGMRLAGGRLSGRWRQGLLLGPRRRTTLGSIPSPRGDESLLHPSSSSSPIVRGLMADYGKGPWGMRLGRLVGDADADGSGSLLGLRWRDQSGDFILLSRAWALSWGWIHRREHSGFALELGLVATHMQPWRGGLRWRFARTLLAMRGGLEALALMGPRPQLDRGLLSGWLSAGQGQELHASLAGEGGAWRWRLARRQRRGIGLGEGESRVETGLELGRPWVGGSLRLRARRRDGRALIAEAAAPGMPRRFVQRRVDEEIHLSWRGAWQLGLVWRGEELGKTSRLLSLGKSLPRPLPVEIRLQVFETSSGAGFMSFEGGQLQRRAESLAGEGWRLGLRSRLERGALKLLLGASWTHQVIGEDRAALWIESRLSQAGS